MSDRIQISIRKDGCKEEVTAEEEFNPLTVISKACEIISLAVSELAAWIEEEETGNA